jgi:hypothetical protein
MAAKCKCAKPEQIRDQIIESLVRHLKTQELIVANRDGWINRRRRKMQLEGLALAIGIVRITPLRSSKPCKHKLTRWLDCEMCQITTGKPCEEFVCIDCGESVE